MAGQHRKLRLTRRIAHDGLEQEPVELRLGQRVGAFMFDRILRREHRKQRIERARNAIGRDLSLRHRFKQRGLRFGRRTINLIAQQQVGEDRSRLKLKAARCIAQHGNTRQVAGHEVGRELHARKPHSECAGERAHQQCLGRAGYALDK